MSPSAPNNLAYPSFQVSGPSGGSAIPGGNYQHQPQSDQRGGGGGGGGNQYPPTQYLQNPTIGMRTTSGSSSNTSSSTSSSSMAVTSQQLGSNGSIPNHHQQHPLHHQQRSPVGLHPSMESVIEDRKPLPPTQHNQYIDPTPHPHWNPAPPPLPLPNRPHLHIPAYGPAYNRTAPVSAPPAMPTYHDPSRRASSPAAVFVPINTYQPMTYKPVPPVLSHHPVSDMGMYPGPSARPPMPPPGFSNPAHGAGGWGGQAGMSGLPPRGGGEGYYRGYGGMGGGDDGDDDDFGYSSQAYDTYRVKHRKRTTPEQLAVLEQAFEENAKPSAVGRKIMAEQIGMTARSVQVWFQNRRQKLKLVQKKSMEDDPDDQDGQDAQEGSHHAYRQENLTVMVPNHSHYTSEPLTHRFPPGQIPHINVPPPNQGVNHGVWSNAPLNGIHHTQANGAGGAVHQPFPMHRRGSVEHVRRSVVSPTSSASSNTPVMRPTPMISQARRGSLPYPPPIPSSGNPAPAQANPAPTITAPRPPIPLHVAISMNSGRRASLPSNARSISLGPFTPPRTGKPTVPTLSVSSLARRELSPIEDHEQQPTKLESTDWESWAMEQTNAQQVRRTSHAGLVRAHQPSQPPTFAPPLFPLNTSFPNSYDGVNAGPLPNPGFSFGTGAIQDYDPLDMTPGGPASAGPPGSAVSSISPNDVMGPNNGAYTFRNRIGSMASILSQATTDGGTTTDGTSDWERQPLPYVPDAPQHQSGHSSANPSPVQESEGGMKKSPAALAVGLTPNGFVPDMRRASAPAELLQKLSTCDLEHPVPHRPSPLGASFVVTPDSNSVHDHDEAGSQSTGREVTPAQSVPSNLNHQSQQGQSIPTIQVAYNHQDNFQVGSAHSNGQYDPYHVSPYMMAAQPGDIDLAAQEGATYHYDPTYQLDDVGMGFEGMMGYEEVNGVAGGTQGGLPIDGHVDWLDMGFENGTQPGMS